MLLRSFGHGRTSQAAPDTRRLNAIAISWASGDTRASSRNRTMARPGQGRVVQEPAHVSMQENENTRHSPRAGHRALPDRAPEGGGNDRTALTYAHITQTPQAKVRKPHIGREYVSTFSARAASSSKMAKASIRAKGWEVSFQKRDCLAGLQHRV